MGRDEKMYWYGSTYAVAEEILLDGSGGDASRRLGATGGEEDDSYLLLLDVRFWHGIPL